MDGAGPEAEEAVARIIERASTPKRRPDPKPATELEGEERVDLSTPHGKVATWAVGEGPATVLVHGWQDSARLWDPLMAGLRGAGQAFIALDLPGHGHSGGERCLLPEITDSVVLAAELAPVRAVVAHSFAASGTAMAVAEGVPAERVVLIAPPLAYVDPSAAAGDAVDAGHQRWRRLADDLGYDPAWGDLALESYLAGLGPERSSWDLSSDLGGLAAEVLLVASSDDERFDLGAARALAADLPNCELVELTGLDHRASARDPAAVEAIVDFVTRPV